MSEWEKVKIGDFLKRIKRPIELDSSKEYKLVTVKLHHKGVRQRCLKVGGKIKSKMYEVKAGDFILSGIDARNGAFGIIPEELDGAIVTNDFWYFDIDEDVIDKHFFLELTRTSWFDEICRLGSDGTTQRIRLQKDRFFNQEVSLPSVEKQRKLAKKLINFKHNKQDLNQQSEHQKETLMLLRQQILQDAIYGKLTADWRAKNPDAEPASKLLEQIKAEKEKLIAEKKIKKGKPLPPISGNERPFDLPEGWEWCRLGEITEIIMGQSPSGDTYNQRGIGIPFFQGKKEFGDIYPIGNSTWCSEPKRLSITNDILISVRAPVGDVNLSDKEYAIGRGLSIIRSFSKKNLNYWFLFYSLKAEHHNWKKKGSFFDSINRNVIEEKLSPLPPRAEQKAIVAKVEKLMQQLDQLEEKNTQNAKDAEMLMQAFLSEVFR